MERILIVEDDVIMGGGIKLYLESKGYEAVLAENIFRTREAFFH